MDLLIATNSVAQAQADVAPVTGTPQWATDGNPSTNTPPTIFPAYAFNAIQGEIVNLIEGGGLTPDRTNLAQALASVLAMFRDGRAVYATDTGVANAYVLTLAPAPTALTAGMTIRFEAANANTGASTLNVNGLGAVPITAQGAALGAGVIVAGGHYEVIYSATAAAWLLLAQTAGAVAGALTQSAADARYVQRSTGIQFAVGAAGTLTANAYIAGYQAPSAVTFPGNFAGSSMASLVAATSAQTINLVKVPAGSTTGTTVGTASFAASSTTATFATTSGAAVSLAAGDRLLAQVASTADATLATLTGTLVGSV